MPFLNLGALKDFEKPQGAESSPKKNVKVSTTVLMKIKFIGS